MRYLICQERHVFVVLRPLFGFLGAVFMEVHGLDDACFCRGRDIREFREGFADILAQFVLDVEVYLDREADPDIDYFGLKCQAQAARQFVLGRRPVCASDHNAELGYHLHKDELVFVVLLSICHG